MSVVVPEGRVVISMKFPPDLPGLELSTLVLTA